MMSKKKKKWLIIGSIIIVLIIAAVVFSRREKPPEYTTSEAIKGTLVQSVNETGTITPAKEINLSFMSGGELIGLSVEVGDTVEVGQVLAQTDFSTLLIRQEEVRAGQAIAQAGLEQALATLAAAEREEKNLQAVFSEQLSQTDKTLADLEAEGIISSSQRQTLVIAETALANTKSTYQQAVDSRQASLVITLDSRLSSLAPTLDSLDNMLTDEDFRSQLRTPTKAYLLLEANELFEKSEDSLAEALVRVAEAKNGGTSYQVDMAYEASQKAAGDIFALANLLFTMLQNINANFQFTQTQLDSYKSLTEVHVNSLSVTISSLQSSRQALDDARLSYNVNVSAAEEQVNQAKLSLGLAIDGTKDGESLTKLQQQQQLDAAKARVTSAQAGVKLSSAQLAQASAGLKMIAKQTEDAVMTSPIEGVITAVNYQVGEQVPPGQPVLSVLTQNNYQVEVDVSETDIAKLSLYDEAEIILDALPDKTFIGSVYFIEPAATVIQGVTYYKVKITFDPGEDERVRTGMTADAVITALRLEDVLTIPARAVLERNGSRQKYVRVLENEELKEVEVETGLNGDGGLVEITKGLKEGDIVITFIREK
ncbi:MAG: efflux RND transporter periplasmic adaptor subunit [Patescibacteria group bacterium]|nr:MAG: efflux RND transporter periplasmic adaptor subunit [Patescibacteria group bacterium]